jgi:hypothetical protein
VSIIEGMLAGAVVMLVLALLSAWLRSCWRNRASARQARRMAQELAEFAEHPSFRWEDRERR